MNKKIKKIIPYCLILIVLVGFFGPTVNVSAQSTDGKGTCFDSNDKPTNLNEIACGSNQGSSISGAKAFYWMPTGATDSSARITPYQNCLNEGGTTTECATQSGAPSKESTSGNALYDSLSSCPPVDGCIAKIIYWLFYSIPNLLLNVVGNFFNVIVALTLYSDLYNKATFVGNAWAVVRDFSNIFFILILLYIGVKIILGLGGSGVKKMITYVIIMAMLINFSMFFTKVVIDTSNILALVFYNKISVTTEKDGKMIDPNYISVLSKDRDRDISGGMMGYFNPTKILTQEFFDNFREETYTFSVKSALLATGTGAIAGNLIPIPGVGAGIGAVVGLAGYALSGFANAIPLSISAGFIIIAGSIIIFATYAFFIAGLAFLSRLIELWILIIFSPFAFMSLAVPKLASIEYIGWDAWSKRLLAVSFMAPIFMFFMYLIFMIIKSNIFISLVARPDPDKQLWMETIILMVIPALIILILLMKATNYAKKSSGVLGEALMSGAKIAGGLALGAATGGAALAGRTILGGGGGATANYLAGKAEKAGFGRVGGKLRDVGDFARKSSFDIRGVKMAGQTLAGATGLKLGETEKGGWTEMKKQQVEKGQKRADELEKRGTKKEKEAVDKAEIDLKEAVLKEITALNAEGVAVELPVKLHLENVDKEIEKARIALNDIKGTGDVVGTEAALEVLREKQAKKDAIRNTPMDINGTMTNIKDLEKVKNKAKVDLDVVSDKITTGYAKSISSNLSKNLNSIFRLGAYSRAGADEAARKIRTGTKLDSGEKPK
ncbi:hypothetical protein A3B85_02205 [Candidatus Nomurabacteria bacterium RIFCSPHIGHO2_02_FULL_37_13]|uniref:Uncharacterized protein n=1 Tax=Candidatus Nomurabacteria bacterium RIFCSPHIGHO2_02_FULL_37_13 TaxID=1801750 RepID=A0A1F6W5S8_9BACT|nr:MAG: hypothetical protein A3B85_02205 [Candidatus Nomurabacteria bacterium RIFCSPHIGHO2_02_FULL_37_13]